MMEQPLTWSSDINKAREHAKQSNKLVLIFFHSNQCTGCKATIAKTLPDPKVSKYIERTFEPVAFEVSDPRSEDLKKQYGFEWTPTFVVTDGSGTEVHRWVGYLPPGDLCAEMMFARGREAFKNKDWEQAAKCYQMVADKFPDSDVSPEALYYSGVAMYEKTHDASYLENAKHKLQAHYPDSGWLKKASVWGK